MNLEDETGFINVIVSPGYKRFARTARDSAALIVRGHVEQASGVTNLVAEHLERLPLAARTRSRDFR
jgi:error-prone DNA polymerase